MIRKYFYVLASVMILGTAISCKKEGLVQPTQPNGAVTSPIPKPSMMEVRCANWVSEGSGKFSDKLEGILNQMSSPQPNSTGIKIYLIEHERMLPINSGFKYRLGVMWGEISKADVTIYYQSDDRTTYLPFTDVTIKIVSQ